MSQHEYPERLSNRGYPEDCTNQTTMEVLVETLTGTAFEMTVSPTDTIFAIKSKIFRVEGIPISQQHLLYNLKELDDASSLREHSIADGARLRLVLGMRGGPVSTRRLPLPTNIDSWKDIERLLDTNREDGEGWGVTMLVYRDGERVNMVRVGDDAKFYMRRLENETQPNQSERKPEEPEGPSHDNLVTMGKMAELRRRMDRLAVRRPAPAPEKAEIQKTRSEEILSVPSLLDEPNIDPFSRGYAYCEAEDTFPPLYDGNYTRYDYGCSFADRYTLLPPIGSRTDSNQSVQDNTEGEGIKLSDALAGSILVQGSRHDSREEEAAILEECLESSVDECPIQESTQLTTKSLAPIQAAEYGPLVGVESGWRVRGFGSSSQLTPAPRSASIHLHQPLSNTVFSSSTSDLEKLKRNRILPALIRHKNREHLHLSDEGLDSRSLEVGSERRQRRINKIAELDARLQEESPEKKEKKIRIRCGFCKKRLSIATVHKCRCGVEYCAPHRYAEVHGCAYDYKANAQEYLQRANPLVSAPKLPKI